MDINDAFRSAYSALVSKPSKILPFYFMSVSVPAVARVAPILTGVLVYLALVRRGHIEEIQAILDDLPADGFDFDDPEAFEQNGFEGEGFDEIREIFELIFVPEVVVIVVAAVVVFILLTIILNAVVSAGQVNAIYSVLVGGEDAVHDGVKGVFSDSTTFALLLLIEAGLLLAVTTVFLVIGVVAVSPGGALAVALGLVVLLAWLLAVLVIHVLFIFAPQSVVVQNRGAVGAIRGNLGFIKSNPVEFIAYAIFVFAAGVALVSVSGFLNVLGAPAAVPVLGFIVFSPFIEVVKTDMFTRHAGDEVILSHEATLSLDRIRRAFRKGWDEMWSFTASHVSLVAVSALLFFGTGAVAWEYTISAELEFETSIADRIEQLTPVGGFVNFTANNWSVGVAQSYAGFVFGIATVVSLVFNGVFLGFIAATEENLTELVAFVVPHGVVEIPALLISGALGLHLGLVAVRYTRGNITKRDVTDEVELAYHVLVGLLILFAVAGFIEAFFSPYYYNILFDL